MTHRFPPGRPAGRVNAARGGYRPDMDMVILGGGPVGGVTGIHPLTHVGEYQGEIVESNILGEPREAHYEAVPDVGYTDPPDARDAARQPKGRYPWNTWSP